MNSPNGGWVAKNIYYLGKSGCIQFNGLRIAGISGIYNEKDYSTGEYEGWPFDSKTIKSVYHLKRFHVERLGLVTFIHMNWNNYLMLLLILRTVTTLDTAYYC